LRLRDFDLWHWLIVVGLVLIVSGVVWYLLPYFDASRRASAVGATLAGMVTSTPSTGPWIYSLPAHNSVGHVGVESHFMMAVPAPTGEVWAILVCVRTMPNGYFLFWGILPRAFTDTSMIWTEFQDCSPREGDPVGVVVDPTGDARSLKKGGWAAGLAISCLDLSTPGQLYVEWMPESRIGSWLDAHGVGGAAADLVRTATSPAIGGLLMSCLGVALVAVGAVKSGAFE